MEHIFQINSQLDIPIYQQLVDRIRAAVKKGELEHGHQLPTVQQTADMLGIARGTIKRAYDELERLGFVEKAQGRGTFVSYRGADTASRKDRAMQAIDDMLDQLEDMGFSAAEVNIFLDLKLRERAQHEPKIRIAVVECNSENLEQMAQQLRQIQGVELYSYLTDSIVEYPYKLDEDIDLVVTTATHAPELEKLIPESKRVVRVALRLTPECLLSLLHIPKGSRVGIISSSPRFGQLLEHSCHIYAEEVSIAQCEVFSPGLDVAAFIHGKDAVLVPKGWEKYCTAAVCEALHGFDGICIECSYELDEGSFLYLQEKTKRMLQAKML